MCFLTRSFSDQQPLEALLGAEATESHGTPSAVTELQIAGQAAVQFLWGLERRGVRPLTKQGFDESLSLDVRPGCVGLGADELEIQGTAGLAPFARAVGRAVIREDTAAGDPLLAEPAHSSHQEADRAGLLLVRQQAPRHISKAPITGRRTAGWRHRRRRGPSRSQRLGSCLDEGRLSHSALKANQQRPIRRNRQGIENRNPAEYHKRPKSYCNP